MDRFQPVTTGTNLQKAPGGRCISLVAGVWLSLMNRGELTLG